MSPFPNRNNWQKQSHKAPQDLLTVIGQTTGAIREWLDVLHLGF